MSCQVPPKGWRCSRVEGHEGPCAASPVFHFYDVTHAFQAGYHAAYPFDVDPEDADDLERYSKNLMDAWVGYQEELDDLRPVEG